MPRCSIVIPVQDGAARTKKCLETLFRTSGDNYEVIVIDDATTDATPAVLAKYAGSVRTVRQASAEGLVAACNRGAALATGEFVVFLSQYAMPLDGWLDALVRHADANPSAAVVGSKVLYPDDTICHAGVAVRQDCIPARIYEGFPATHPAVEKSRKFQIVSAFSVLIHCEAFVAESGFDRAFRHAFADADFCLRLAAHGREVHYCHKSVVHNLAASDRSASLETQTPDYAVFRNRWETRLRPDDLRYYVEDGLLKLDYEQSGPLWISASPLVAEVSPAFPRTHNGASRIENILQLRSRQIHELISQNQHLQARLKQSTSQAAKPATLPAPTVAPSDEPKTIHCGSIRWMSPRPSREMASILLPVKNGSARLKELLPVLMSQRTRCSVEIIAVDSGSRDDSVRLLVKHDATVLTIAPHTFNHGLTRNLLAQHAKGDVLVFLNQGTLPANEDWLENLIRPLLDNAEIAATCSRVLPLPNADVLQKRAGENDLNASAERRILQVSDPKAFKALSPGEMRFAINFHSISAAIRQNVFAHTPFRAVRIGEDVLWAREILEKGLKIQHEPTSVVLHSHNYSPLEWLQRNFDDGELNQRAVGAFMPEDDVLRLMKRMIMDDWRYLASLDSIPEDDMANLKAMAAIRRTAQLFGQWFGINSHGVAPISLLSLTERIKAGNSNEVVPNARSAG